ncbi:MAG TPA: hypothetical protein VH558_04125 [Pseudolabrys sp.]
MLPGECAADFEKLRRAVTVEFKPAGPLEEDVVDSVVRLIWRKQNMGTYRRAKSAKALISAIRSRYHSYEQCAAGSFVTPTASERAEENALREDLGTAAELADMEAVTTDYLLDELAVLDRLDASIDRCLKRLLMVRGVKSMSIKSP